MADRRKLLAEIDRCLKKVNEGVETFDEIWVKVHNATNANQKEKYEADLKKEIKKLQRQRDQIKTWLASSEVKDKRELSNYRRLIEMQMERFKVVERETKTKAYSKEGLGAAQKLDPAQKEKDDITNWLSNSIEKLSEQVELFESELENLQTTQKKGKKDREKQERHDFVKNRVEKHRYHIKQLETLMRMLDNETVEVDQIKKIKDDIEYYIESSQDAEFQDNEYIYDDLDLEDMQAFRANNVVDLTNVLGNAAGKNEKGSATKTNDNSTTSSTANNNTTTANVSMENVDCNSLPESNNNNQNAYSNSSSTSESPAPSPGLQQQQNNSHHSTNATSTTTTTSSTLSKSAMNNQNNNNNNNPLSANNINSNNSTEFSFITNSVTSNHNSTPTSVTNQSSPSNNNTNNNNNKTTATTAVWSSSTATVKTILSNNNITSTTQSVTTPYAAAVASSVTGSGTSLSSSSSSSTTKTSSSVTTVTNDSNVQQSNDSSSMNNNNSSTSTVVTLYSAAAAAASTITSAPSAVVSNNTNPNQTNPWNASNLAAIVSNNTNSANNSQQQQQQPPIQLTSQQQQYLLQNNHLINGYKGIANVENLKGLAAAAAVAQGMLTPSVTNAASSGLDSDLLSGDTPQANALLSPALIANAGGQSAVLNNQLSAAHLNDLGPNQPNANQQQQSFQHLDHLNHANILKNNLMMHQRQMQAVNVPVSSVSPPSNMATIVNQQSKQPPPVPQPPNQSNISQQQVDVTKNANIQNQLNNLVNQQQQTQPNQPPQSQNFYSSTMLSSQPNKPTISKQTLFHMHLLDAAFRQPIIPIDSYRLRPLHIKLPQLHTYSQMSSFPNQTLSQFNNIEFYDRLTPETLFFIFYYMEGSKAQYMAAKTLKNKSWRFHTKYMMWFQRLEEPKLITDDYEQGTYIYFDFEKWTQRKKENFVFEYKFLEDKELN
ncbi:CCR4-associated factor Not3 [Dermatophagoides pteronyssinus]|uniref:CCR4-associated factor Not3 n=1 Tax=Dermatophagoides pteronyssinus TaxID=6956 RepID=UPI003F674744